MKSEKMGIETQGQKLEELLKETTSFRLATDENARSEFEVG